MVSKMTAGQMIKLLALVPPETEIETLFSQYNGWKDEEWFLPPTVLVSQGLDEVFIVPWTREGEFSHLINAEKIERMTAPG